MSKTPEQIDNEKHLAATAALQWVRDGMLLGLGTASTSAHFIRALAQRLQSRNETVEAVATSEASARLATELGIKVRQPERGLVLDLTVDGADEIGPGLALIKGGGGALLREKVVASASKSLLIIADSSKPTLILGKFPLPLEVVPFSVPWVMDRVQELGGNPQVRVRDGKEVLSDQGNNLIDCSFGSIADPVALAVKFEKIPGIAEHGLFLGMAEGALVANDGTVRLLRADGSSEEVAIPS